MSKASFSGPWDPTLLPSSHGSILLNARSASWVKSDIGIMCTFDIEVISMYKGTEDSTIRLGNLPFTSSNALGYVGSLYVAYFSNMNSDIQYFAGTISSNSTTSELWFNRKHSNALKRLTQSDLKPTSRIVGTINYTSL